MTNSTKVNKITKSYIEFVQDTVYLGEKGITDISFEKTNYDLTIDAAIFVNKRVIQDVIIRLNDDDGKKLRDYLIEIYK